MRPLIMLADEAGLPSGAPVLNNRRGDGAARRGRAIRQRADVYAWENGSIKN